MRPLGPADPNVVAGYRILGLLGAGGMGRVYLGQSRSGRRLAIKVIRADLAENPDFRRRFAREVAAARAVSPLFTAAVVDADPDAAEPWLATTFIEGPSLQQWVDERGPLAPEATLTLAAGLAEALASIHGAGLTHRDLKPANVLLNDEGPHIIDFGLALAHDSPNTTGLFGTPSYMAPERIHRLDDGPAGDMFSLGATLVFASTGRRLVDGGTVVAQIAQVTTGRFDLSPVPPQVRPIVARCVRRQPRHRPTADELVEQLTGAAVTPPSPGWHTTPAPPSGGPTTDTGPSRRRLLMAAGATGVAVIASGVIALLPTGRRRPRAGASSGPASASPSGAAAGTLSAPIPGSVVWQLSTGMGPPGGGPPGPTRGRTRLVLPAQRRVVATGADGIVALDFDGNRAWGHPMAEPVELRDWNGDVLVTDLRRARVLDAATGTERMVVDAADDEERAARDDNNADDILVELYGVALTPDRAYLDLGTATIAVDRDGDRLWRRPRPRRPADNPGGTLRTDPRRRTPGDPLVVGGGRLVTQDVTEKTLFVDLRDVRTGRREWTVSYPTPPIPNGPGPDGRPPDRPGRPGGPGGPDGPGGPPGGPDEAWARSAAHFVGRRLVARTGSEVRVLRRDTGATVWHRVSKTPVVAAVVMEDLVLVSADLLYAYRLTDGDPVWRLNLRGSRLAAAPAHGLLIVANARSLLAVDLRGTVRWRAELATPARPGRPDRILVAGDRVYLTLDPGERGADPSFVDVVALTLA
jgi:serine/threonine protein kinase